MVSGNGNQGVMVPGKPQKEKMVINHTKLWVPAQSVTPDVPDMTRVVARARELAKDGKYGDASSVFWGGFGAGNEKMFPKEDLIRNGPRLGLNYVHPAAYLQINDGGGGKARDYSRTCNFETGEITTRWTDDAGTHQRQVFCDRVNDITLVRLSRPDGKPFSGSVALAPRPGWNPKDISNPIIKHTAKASSLAKQARLAPSISTAGGVTTMTVTKPHYASSVTVPLPQKATPLSSRQPAKSCSSSGQTISMISPKLLLPWRFPLRITPAFSPPMRRSTATCFVASA